MFCNHVFFVIISNPIFEVLILWRSFLGVTQSNLLSDYAVLSQNRSDPELVRHKFF